MTSLSQKADATETPAAGKGRNLGAMRELGVKSDQFHADLAPYVVSAGISSIIVVGNEMKPLATALGRRVEVIHVADAPAAQTEIDRLLGKDDVLLVKGSNSVRLGDVVAHLKNRDGRGPN